MKIGVCSITFRHKTVDEVIEIAKSVCLDAIEWGADVHVKPGDILHAQQVKQKTEAAKLEVSSYGSYYVVGKGEDVQPIVDTARALGAPSVRVWAGAKGSDTMSEEERRIVTEDLINIGERACASRIRVDVEYHKGTLTDTPKSAERLMNETNHENVRLYWQPAESISYEERMASIEQLHTWTRHVHVFHWKDTTRLPLRDGAENWQRYIDQLAGADRYFLLEFVRGNDDQQFLDDARVLKKWLSRK
ncbi:sugar phosphate isomerase/epimerase family protein [Geomicrobium sp. JSM 1781026]|uniref:sugar phosphate isomerase/epimerase family protein n=1 Tax=Geomicrobium sp. JSM 1781026 TaxID=3344580 RepID=UPI0035C14EAE